MSSIRRNWVTFVEFLFLCVKLGEAKYNDSIGIGVNS